jgi:hypothetical protein
MCFVSHYLFFQLNTIKYEYGFFDNKKAAANALAGSRKPYL